MHQQTSESRSPNSADLNQQDYVMQQQQQQQQQHRANYETDYPYGQYGQNYYGSSSTGYLNSPAMASFLYPHLYPSTMNPSLHLPQQQQEGGGLDEYVLSSEHSNPPPPGAGATNRDVSYLDVTSGAAAAVVGADESQTGPIRGGYSARTEHGGHVWRPY